MVAMAKWMMAGLLGTANAAMAQTTTRYESKLEGLVAEHVTSGDCAGALKLIHGGLAANSPRAALLAGAMYEHGICLKPNWDSAVGNYVIAHNGGEHAAALRLAAGYATKAAGPDAAAALWWLSQSGTMQETGQCAVDKAERGDPDRFVAVLQTWTPKRLTECNYVVGVVATISGETQYPYERRTLEPEGRVIVRFQPGIPKVDIWTPAERGLFSAAPPAGQQYAARATRKSRFEQTVQVIADRALARYVQPAGIDPAWFYDVGFTFERTAN